MSPPPGSSRPYRSRFGHSGVRVRKLYPVHLGPGPGQTFQIFRLRGGKLRVGAHPGHGDADRHIDYPFCPLPLGEPFSEQNKNPEPSVLGFVAERWGFEPQNAFDTLHDFQSCALDQLSHLSTSSVLTASGRGPQRSTIIPERRSFVKLFFKKVCIFSKMTKQRMRWGRERRKSS